MIACGKGLWCFPPLEGKKMMVICGGEGLCRGDRGQNVEREERKERFEEMFRKGNRWTMEKERESKNIET